MDVKAAVIRALNKYTETNFASSETTEDLTLEQLKLDSLDVLELIYELEEEFQLELESSQLRNIETLSQLITVFEVHIRQAA